MPWRGLCNLENEMLRNTLFFHYLPEWLNCHHNWYISKDWGSWDVSCLRMQKQKSHPTKRNKPGLHIIKRKLKSEINISFSFFKDQAVLTLQYLNFIKLPRTHKLYIFSLFHFTLWIKKVSCFFLQSLLSAERPYRWAT